MKYLKWFLFILLILIIFIIILAFSNEEIISSDKLDREFLIDRVVFQSNLDIYDKNTVNFNEKEVNGLLAKRLVEKLNSSISNDPEIQNIYLHLKNEKIVAKTSFKSLPVVITMDLSINLQNDKINFKASNFKIGKLPLPKFLFNSLGLKDINNSLYINTNDLTEIDILNINLNKENIEISYKTNNDEIIEKYIPSDQKKFIKEMESILEENEVSKKLANNIIRVALLYGNNKEIPQNLINDLKNNFIDLDNKIKANLVFITLQYNIDYFIEILLK
ncbi:hypothetical protein [Senegalia massiliensis]|uniref:Uncharacterized protein n=1 Tax=Senegalia massiliensis TaxID=1720316 RepID=A0A845QTH4_9CLOT|nr:hypothetical protein [Senegalia massiliensis]NBI05845.1 hypothetical protein [Senegalia massiliensis]